MSVRQNLRSIIEDISNSYDRHPVSESQFICALPNKAAITEITEKIMEIIFPGYFGEDSPDTATLPYYIGGIILDIEPELTRQIVLALNKQNYDKAAAYAETAERRAEEITLEFLRALPRLREMMACDVQAAFDGDPAAIDKDIVIFCYPGVYAVGVYRIAHELLKLGTPYIPRIMTEYAHSKTGIDIHPGAQIGKYFFIDHGTGVVIGETTVIGENVKLYQGVTLGALSTKGGQSLAGAKRHPTLEDNVTIYSGATVLGGDTVIGKNVVIGGNEFITRSRYKCQK